MPVLNELVGGICRKRSEKEERIGVYIELHSLVCFFLTELLYMAEQHGTLMSVKDSDTTVDRSFRPCIYITSLPPLVSL